MKAWILILSVLLPILLPFSNNGGETLPLDSGAQDRYSYPGVAVRFEHLGIEDGLSQNTGFTLLQDQQGYIWIGTQEGLNRYDGYSFSVFKHQPEDATSISHNSILALYEDSQGVIWVGTWGGGVNRFDKVTESFTRYQPDADDPTSLSHGLVTSILEDLNGNIWIGTLDGLNLLNQETGEFTHFKNHPSDANTLSGNAISALYADLEGNLWVGTGAFGVRGYRLNRLDIATGQVERVTLNCVAESAISTILPDADGNLWLAHGGYNLPGSGLTHYSPTTGDCVNFRADPINPDSLSNDNITDILMDGDGALWISTLGGGINRMDLQTPGMFLHYQHDPFYIQSLSSNDVFSLMIDQTGVLWIGTINSGINKLNPATLDFRLYQHNPIERDSLSSNNISAFAENPDGSIWVGTRGGGLNLFDSAAGTFLHSDHNPDEPYSLGSDTISALEMDVAGKLWIGTRAAGVDQFDPETGRFTHFRRNLLDPTSLWSDNITTLLSEDDTLWVGTLAGLDRMDAATGHFTHYVYDPSKSDGLSHPSVISLYLDQWNQLWIGTWGGGLNRLNLNEPDNLSPFKAEFTHFQYDPNDPGSIGDNNVWAIYQSKNGILWLGTQGGLSRFEPADESFRVYRERDGLQGETVYGIMEDDAGFLWLMTNNGLARFDPDTETFKIYDRANGLQSNEFNPNAYYHSVEGEMYVGGDQGFNIFSAENIQSNPMPPPVVVTRFMVLNEAFEADLTGRNPIQLNYDQNFVSFEFAALDFSAPQKNQFIYQLEGFDQDWIAAGARPFVSYTNLPGGNYTFRVKAANSDGVWNEKGIALPLVVTPPFWETQAFQITVVIFLGGLVIAWVQWRVRSLRERSRELESSVQERTQALQETNLLLTEQIDQRQRAEAALAQKAAEEAVTSERTRLAHEFHDAVTQTLFSASLIAEVLPDLWKIDRSEAKNSTDELRQLTRGALAEMRTLLLELRPVALTQARLADLLQQLTEATVGRARLPISLNIEGARALPPDVKIVFYRIAQESIHNIIKHARATQVMIDLQFSPTGANLEITDDGIGFELDKVKPTSLGVRIMGERAAKIGADFQIRSTVGDGTTIIVTWYDKPTKESQND